MVLIRVTFHWKYFWVQFTFHSNTSHMSSHLLFTPHVYVIEAHFSLEKIQVKSRYLEYIGCFLHIILLTSNKMCPRKWIMGHYSPRWNNEPFVAWTNHRHCRAHLSCDWLASGKFSVDQDNPKRKKSSERVCKTSRWKCPNLHDVPQIMQQVWAS